MMRALWLSLRRVSLTWIIIAAFSLEIWTIITHESKWYGVWPTASSVVQFGGMYIGPLFGGYAAYIIAREANARLDVFSVKALWLRHYLVIMRLWMGSLISVAGACLYVWLMQIQAGAHGWFWPSYLLILGVQTLVCITVGVILGTLMPSWYGVVVTVIAGYMLLTVPLDGTRHAMNVIVGDSVYVQLVPRKIVSYALVGMALLLLSFALRLLKEKYSGWYSHTKIVLSCVMCAGMVGACVVALSQSGRLVVAREAPENPLCIGEEPQFCGWPENAVFLKKYEDLSPRFARIKSAGLKVPQRFIEYGIDRPANQENGGDVEAYAPSQLTFRSGTGLDYFTYSDFASRIVSHNVEVCWPHTSDTPDGGSQMQQPIDRSADATTSEDKENEAKLKEKRDQLWQAHLEVSEWVTMVLNGGPPPQDMKSTSPVNPTEVARVVASDENEQREWLESRMSFMRSSCG